MKKSIAAIILTASLALMAAAQATEDNLASQPPPLPTPPAPPKTAPQPINAAPQNRAQPKASQEVMTAGNLFGFQVMDSLLQTAPAKNYVISPWSINLALSMCADGASGATQTAMLNTLGLQNLPIEIIQKEQSIIQTQLLNSGPDLTVSVASSIFADEKTPFKQSYLLHASKIYSAQIKSVPFENPSTVSEINSWVSSKTNGRIPSIISSLKKDDRMVLLNAVYFNGMWQTPFPEMCTRKGDFTLLGGGKKQVEMMENVQRYHYAETDGMQITKIPYAGGGRFSLWVFLPNVKAGEKLADQSARREFFKRLSELDLPALSRAMQTEEVHVRLPKLKLECDESLNESLCKMGMALAFDRDRAGFENMMEPKEDWKVWIQAVLHKTFVEMNEKGTEAAAATAVIMGACRNAVAQPPRPKEFFVDRPYAFAIRDDQTGAILFLGAITNPQ